MSAVGAVGYERAYYYCRHCGHGATPADTTLRIDQAELTPAACELAALAGTLSSFAEAAEKVLPKLAGMRVSESTVERTTENAGAAVGERLGHGEVFGDAQPWAWSQDAAGQTVGYVSLDATGVGIPGPNGTAAIDWPRSFSVRSSSPMIQLLAAFEFPAALAVASK